LGRRRHRKRCAEGIFFHLLVKEIFNPPSAPFRPSSSDYRCFTPYHVLLFHQSVIMRASLFLFPFHIFFPSVAKIFIFYFRLVIFFSWIPLFRSHFPFFRILLSTRIT
jgi:hypothetical protein